MADTDKKTNNEMKNLGNLSPQSGSHRSTKRLGRGIGSGLGKTAGKGHKGQKARKSGGVRPGFEGGSMPIYMRLPKRGFTKRNQVQFNEINLDQLNKFDDGVTVDVDFLNKAGALRQKKNPVKVLGRGELSKKLTLVVHKISANAKAAVEKAGGSVQLIPDKVKSEGKKAKGKKAPSQKVEQGSEG